LQEVLCLSCLSYLFS